MKDEEGTGEVGRGVRPVYRRVVFWWALVTMGCGGFVVWWYVFTPSSAFIEVYYYRVFYRWILGVVVPMSDAVPFSVALVILVVVPLVFLGSWVVAWRRTPRVGRIHWKGILWGAQWGALLVALCVSSFVVLCGGVYRRLPIETRLGFDEATVSGEDAEFLLDALLEIVEANMDAPRDRDRAVASIALAMEEAVGFWEGVPYRLPYRAKSTPKGLLLLSGTAGIFSPFTMEAHVDGALPEASFVSVAGHELGHVAGSMVEAEATLLGYVGGLAAEDDFARYAVALDIYVDLASRLQRDTRDAAFARLPAVSVADLQASYAAVERYRLKLKIFERVAEQFYDTYLKAQGIEEGMANYSRGVVLFVSAWRKGFVALPRLPE